MSKNKMLMMELLLCRSIVARFVSKEKREAIVVVVVEAIVKAIKVGNTRN